MATMSTGLNGKKGEFVRSAANCREFVSADHPVYKPAKGRYHLVVSYACPWANRCLIVRAMKGLEDVIGFSVVHPIWGRTKPDQDEHCGWIFEDAAVDEGGRSNPAGIGPFKIKGCVPLPSNIVPGAKTVRDLYDAGAAGTRVFSVPLLWDTETNTVVNNESSEIVQMLNSGFDDFASNPGLDLNTSPDLQKEVDAWTYPQINNGVYRCGFAKTQEAYDEASATLFAGLDKLEAILDKHRFVCGDTLTLSDIRIFMTLARFDEVYVVYFKCNQRPISSYPNLRNYCRDLYQTPHMAEWINMEHIKVHYFTSHPTLNTYAIVPTGPNAEADFKLPHDRATRKYTN